MFKNKDPASFILAKQKGISFHLLLFWQITLIWIQAAPHNIEKALGTKRFSAFCTRLLYLPDWMVCSVRSGFFVFTSEIEKLIKSNRVKDGVIVCEIGIRVRNIP